MTDDLELLALIAADPDEAPRIDSPAENEKTDKPPRDRALDYLAVINL